LKIYTEDSKTDNRGGGPVANAAWDFKKGRPVSMAGFFFKDQYRSSKKSEIK